ncbi:hypothetical protein AURDEDRAFT_178022 [Auricularia subglabra TFB-10046 SS5]|uniref:CCHC-type domain-containing protein n=1 Tax=Auricularia subglabra (strain TFB-10046 / SS5) TaxID=717982 RepID=J0WKQ4_AURST|nr:hypothetical protein AURDEDRAFT_178022 [Auricularia subglabra TFB-10046 SS5]
MDSENDGAVDSDGAHSVGNTLIIEAIRSMIGDLRTHVDGKFSDHQAQAQDSAEKVTLLTQTVTALQDQVTELQNRRERSRSRSSRASSMPEEQKLARRAEKRPEVPSAPPPGSSAVVPVIAQPLQGDPLSPGTFAAQFDKVDQFNGSFPTIPADLPSGSTAPLPVSTVGGSSAASTNANKPLATTPARPGSTYPTHDDKNCWRCGKFGHIGRNCPDVQPAAVTARTNAGALVHFNSTSAENPREIVIHDDLADHSEHRGDDAFGERAATSAIKVGSAETPRDEYVALGYTAQDIEAVYDDPDTSRWVFNDDDDE